MPIFYLIDSKAAIWAYILITVLILIVLKRNDVDIAYEIETPLEKQARRNPMRVIRMLKKTFSLIKARQKKKKKKKLEKRILALTVIENFLQKYRYYAEVVACLHPANHEQKLHWERATREIRTLPLKVL